VALAAGSSRWKAALVFVIGLGVVLFFLLPSPWNVVALAGGVLVGSVETLLWWYALGRRPVLMGAETMIGRPGKVVEACEPLGKVALLGELWQARCELGARSGETVRVVGRDGLLLIVEPAEP
jgi:membrane-bound serine protease (ClpP class)